MLDTETDAEIDAIVAEVSEALDMPIVMLSLIDANRHWSKARVGIDPQEFPREVSICSLTILQDGVLSIGDMRADPRSADNPFVTGPPFLRFYAGVPLATRQGPKLGTLCVLDTIARTLTDAQAATLARAATEAMTVLNVRRLENAFTREPGIFRATL